MTTGTSDSSLARPAAPGLFPGWLKISILLVVVAAGAWQLGWRARRPPGDVSPEANFARDMSVHHAQAVEMALIMLQRSHDSEIRILAEDIALTQQAQIGRMSGWLDAWGLPATGPAVPMGSMGHQGASMPGMASRNEIASLQRLPQAEAERVFLRLMIRHHQGGIKMARAFVEWSHRPEVVRLAKAIVDSQQAEIAAMVVLLRR